MKIQKLAVNGFRSLADIKWAPGDLNILIGPNASGKSNLLRVFEVLSASARGVLEKYVQREGGMEPLVWDGSASSTEFLVEQVPRDGIPIYSRYSLGLKRLGRTSSYRMGYELLDEFGASDFKWIDRSPSGTILYDEERHLPAFTDMSEVETVLSSVGGPLSPFKSAKRIQENLASWMVYQNLNTGRDSVLRMPSVSTVSKRVAPDAHNLISVLHTLYTSDRDFEEKVDMAMGVAFGSEYEKLIFPPDADQRVQLRVRWKSLKRAQSAADLSDGTLRFLFLLAALANPDPPPIIAIDEPDIGLHPGMLPIIAEFATGASERSQVVLTTHSPAFLDAFAEATPTITVVSSVEGRTNLQVLSGEKLKYWLKHYTLGEMYRTGELEAMEQ
jgi:predicted ATPase